MENRQALKLIEKIQKELFKDNFEVSEIVTDLKKLREITLELNNPVVTKALRLAYEHLENNNGFFIGIPDDEPVDSKDAQVEANISEENNIESLIYHLILCNLVLKYKVSFKSIVENIENFLSSKEVIMKENKHTKREVEEIKKLIVEYKRELGRSKLY